MLYISLNTFGEWIESFHYPAQDSGVEISISTKIRLLDEK